MGSRKLRSVQLLLAIWRSIHIHIQKSKFFRKIWKKL